MAKFFCKKLGHLTNILTLFFSVKILHGTQEIPLSREKYTIQLKPLTDVASNCSFSLRFDYYRV